MASAPTLLCMPDFVDWEGIYQLTAILCVSLSLRYWICYRAIRTGTLDIPHMRQGSNTKCSC